MERKMGLFRAFHRGEDGNVALMFALALVPLFGVVGAAVDFSRVSQTRAQLADALDAGVLAVGSQPEMSEAEAYQVINDWITAHLGDKYAGKWQLDSVTLGDGGSILATASGSVDTTLARVLGIYEMQIGVTSEAVRSLGKVEVVLVLDNTGSMKGTKLTKLKEAANALVDTLVDATADPEDLRIGLVPFSMTVNVGSGYQNASWIDNNATSPIHDDIFDSNYNRFAAFNKMNVAWAGCVEGRPYPHDVEETEPSASDPETLYVPYFAPDEPDPASKNGNGNFGTFYNNYISDKKYSKTNWKVPQGYTLKYNNATPKTGTNSSTGYIYGPNAGCQLAALVRLTPDAEPASIKKVTDAIDAMTAVGDTNIPIGLAWGWNVLSPTGPFGDGIEYGDDEWNKIVVLMTDGQNQNTDNSNPNDSFYSGVGYIWQDRLGVVAGSSSTKRREALDGRLSELCTNMKAEAVDIQIYTVRVEVTTGSSQVLKDCATEPDYFYDVENVADLTDTFTDIGGSIQKLRLSK
jgi:Flp pilus assembly protein TadG